MNRTTMDVGPENFKNSTSNRQIRVGGYLRKMYDETTSDPIDRVSGLFAGSSRGWVVCGWGRRAGRVGCIHHRGVVSRLGLERGGRKGARDKWLEGAQFSLPTANIARPYVFSFEWEQGQETDLEPALALGLEDAAVVAAGTDPGLAVAARRVDLRRTSYRETDTAFVTHLFRPVLDPRFLSLSPSLS